MVFHWSLSDNKSPQVSVTLLSILVDLNNAVVLMVSSRPLIFKSSSPCNNPFVTVPSAPITTGITVTFVFHSFRNSLARSRYFYFFFFHFLSVLFCCQSRQQNPQLRKFSFLWIIIRSGDLFGCQNPRGVCVSHFSGQMLGCTYTICSYGQISISCAIPSWSPCLPSRL